MGVVQPRKFDLNYKRTYHEKAESIISSKYNCQHAGWWSDDFCSGTGS